MAKGRKVSGIFVPIQLDTSLVEQDLSKLKDSFGQTITAMQKGMSNALSSYKLGVGLVDINRAFGQLRDSANALSRTRISEFTKSIQGAHSEIQKMANTFGGTAKQYEQLIVKIAETQAINQQVNALKKLRTSLDLTAAETVRTARQMGLALSDAAVIKFTSQGDITSQLSKVSEEYRRLATLSGTPISNEGFTAFLDEKRIAKAVSAFKELNGTQTITKENFDQIARAAGVSYEKVEKFLTPSKKLEDLTAKLSKVSEEYRRLATLSGTPISNEGFTAFLDEKRIAKAVSAFKELNGVQTITKENFDQIARAAGVSRQQVAAYVSELEKSRQGGRGWVGAFTPSNITAGIQSGLSAFGVVGGAYGAAELTKSMYQSALRMENIDFAFKSIYNSATEASAKIQFVREVTEELGLSFTSVADGAKKLFASAQGTVLEDDAQQIFRSFSTMGAALKLSGEKMESVFLAISQMISKGKVSAEELRLQLAERMPGAVNIFAKAIGVTTSELDKMLQEGKVGLEDLRKFSIEVEKRYASGAQGASRGLQAELGRAQNAWFDLKKSFIDTNASAQYMRGITEGIKSLTAVAPTLKTIASEVAKFTAALTVAYPTVLLFSKSVAMFKKDSKGAGLSLTKFTSNLTAFGNSLLGGATIAATLGVALYDLATSLDEGQKALDRMNSSLDDHVKLLGEANNAQGSGLSSALSIAKKDYDNLVSELDKVLYPNREVEIGFGFTKTQESGFRRSLMDIAGIWTPSVEERKLLSEAANYGAEVGEKFKEGLKKANVFVETFKGSGPQLTETLDYLQTLIDQSVIEFRSKQADLVKAGLSDEEIEKYKVATGGLIELYKKLLEQLRERASLERELSGADAGINIKGYEDAIKKLNEASKNVKLFEDERKKQAIDDLGLSVGAVVSEFDSLKAAMEAGKITGEEFTSKIKDGNDALRSFAAQALESGVNINDFVSSVVSKFPDVIQQASILRDVFSEIANIKLSKGLDDFITNMQSKVAFVGKSSSLQSLYDFAKGKVGVDQSAEQFIKMASTGDFSGLTIQGAAISDEALNKLKEAYDLTKKLDAAQKSLTDSKRASKLANQYDSVQKKIEELTRQYETWNAKTKESKTDVVNTQLSKYLADIDRLLKSGKATAEQSGQLRKLRKDLKSAAQAYQEYIQIREKEKAADFYRDVASEYSSITGINDPALIQQSAQSVYDERLAEAKRFLEIEAITKEQYRQLEIMLETKKNDTILRNSQDLYDNLQLAVDDYYAKYRNFATGMKDVMTTAIDGISTAIADFAVSGMRDLDNFGQAVSNLVDNIFASITKLFAQQFVSSVFSYFMPTKASAKGNVFSGGLSSYSDSIVSKPTYFTYGSHIKAFARGGGLMGEAGPEAVMPLIRTPSGHLGVRANGSGSVQQNVNVNIINNAGVGVEQRESTDNQGNTNLMIILSKEMAKDMSRHGSPMNRSLQNVYNARPVLANR